jgi:hypothetical protein
LTNVPDSTALIPGNGGSLIGIARNPYDSGAFVIEGDTATFAADLHQMAMKSHELLLKTAPEQSRPPGDALGSSWSGSNPSIARAGEVVWINHRNIVEAYRNGESLEIQKRLTLMNCPKDWITMLGPLKGTGGEKMVVVPRITPNRHMTVFWALPGTDGIELQRSEEPELRPLGLQSPGLASFTALDRGDVVLVVAPEKGCLYSSSGDIVMEASGPKDYRFIRQAGSPLLATRESGLIVRRAKGPYGGCRVCFGETRREIKCTFSRILEIMSETGDGQLLCSSPEGITWLTRRSDGDYTPDRDLPVQVGGMVRSFVGETASQVFVTVTDTDQAYLAVLDKP